MIRQKGLDNKKGNENTKKYIFQGHYARSIRWFDLDHEWLEENFRTREPYLYKNRIKRIRGEDKKHIKYLQYELVMHKQQEKYSSTHKHQR